MKEKDPAAIEAREPGRVPECALRGGHRRHCPRQAHPLGSDGKQEEERPFLFCRGTAFIAGRRDFIGPDVAGALCGGEGGSYQKAEEQRKGLRATTHPAPHPPPAP
jgi:hypothetical protein